ncbi:hypothetical protein FRC00_014061 [Tulasnella sp. 408]|nr:hypothetical protein FRC00_014061 [Tulasnella sp. 408]
MSPVQDIVAFAIQVHLKHYSSPEESTLLTTDASLATESAKDSMIEVLNNLQSLVKTEITRQLIHLKRRRNQEHAQIYQLPQEVFVEIVRAATSSASDITDPFTLMRVSKYWNDWGDWDDPATGISIKLFPSTVDSLRNLLNGLVSRLQAARWKPEALDLSFFRGSQDTFGTEIVPPLLLNFPLTFQTIKRLDLALPSSSIYGYALRRLEDAIPELTSLVMYDTYAPPSEEWINGIKAFLERRYPLQLQRDTSVHQRVSRLAKIYLPDEVVESLQQDWPDTSLSMGEVLSTIEALH